MSREHRKHKRKARNAELRDNPPKPSVIPALAARDPSTRWSNLTARGGVRMSLVPVGPRIPVDLDDAAAPATLTLSVTGSHAAEA